MKLADAIDLVLPFVSTDETSPHLCKPARHPAHVVGTDGHTLACVRVDDPTENDLVRTLVGSAANGTPVPRFDYVLPAAPRLLGMWNPAGTPMLAYLPRTWTACVQFGGGRGTSPTVEAWLPARTGSRGKVLRPKIQMIRTQAIDGFDEISDGTPERIGVCAAYLARVAAFFEAPMYVYGTDPLSPLVFVQSAQIATKADLLGGPGFAIVMPMRI